MTFNWNSPFSNTRRSSQEAAQPVSVAHVAPTDLVASLDRLKAPPGKVDTPASNVNPLNFGSFGTLNVLIGLTAQLVLPAPTTKRIYLLIQNTHPTQNLFVGFGNSITSTAGIKIPPGGNYELNATVPQDDVNLAADGLNTSAVIVYSNKGVNEGM